MTVDFTREPIIESVITPKDGWTLVVRSSKSSGQEEYFVDALEIVSFGTSLFFRSCERPKSFLVPVTDYEVLEVRETRLVLKNASVDRAIKIGSGREFSPRQHKEPPEIISEPPMAHVAETATPNVTVSSPELQAAADGNQDSRLDKKRERKRNYRRKRSREGVAFREEEDPSLQATKNGEGIDAESSIEPDAAALPLSSVISGLLPPPPTLISETIARYKDNALFKDAFFLKKGIDANCADTIDTNDTEQAVHQDVTVDQSKGLENENLDDLVEEEVQIPLMSLDFPVYSPESSATAKLSEDIEENILLSEKEQHSAVPLEGLSALLLPTEESAVNLILPSERDFSLEFPVQEKQLPADRDDDRDDEDVPSEEDNEAQPAAEGEEIVPAIGKDGFVPITEGEEATPAVEENGFVPMIEGQEALPLSHQEPSPEIAEAPHQLEMDFKDRSS